MPTLCTNWPSVQRWDSRKDLTSLSSSLLGLLGHFPHNYLCVQTNATSWMPLRRVQTSMPLSRFEQFQCLTPLYNNMSVTARNSIFALVRQHVQQASLFQAPAFSIWPYRDLLLQVLIVACGKCTTQPQLRDVLLVFRPLPLLCRGSTAF